MTKRDEGGFTLVELTVTIVVIAIVVVSLFGLFTSLVHSTIIAKRRAVANTLATNQMEYLKSLPYANLAVQGGSIYATSLLPATATTTINGVKYTTTTAISYVDDAYDGCGSYPNATIKASLCRGYNSSTTSTTDTNPADYKIAHVSVTDPTGLQLASVDTEIAGSVAETSSTTGALFVSVLDQSGAALTGATVQAVNATVTPAVSVADTTDSNGVAVFYDLPPDSAADYVITASKSSYSSLGSIAISGSLTPTYPNQKILTQQSSYVTMTLKQQGSDSLLVETTDTAGSPLAGVKVYVKGGYKKYTSVSDTQYYYDNVSGSDTRPTTDATGLAGISNLVPGSYMFCGDDGTSNCKVGSTTYYLVAAVPYGGTNSLNPITVPTYSASSPPATTYAYGGTNYYQKVRLMFSSSATFPRVFTLSPNDLSKAATNLSSFSFVIAGQKLTCASTAASCATSVKFVQGGTTYTASCTGASTGLQLTCSANLTGIATGTAQLVVSNTGGTLSLPTTPLGGLSVNN